MRSIEVSQRKEIKPTSIFDFAVLQPVRPKVAAIIPFQWAVRAVSNRKIFSHRIIPIAKK